MRNQSALQKTTIIQKTNRLKQTKFPKIVGVGTGVCPNSYTQEELLEIFNVKDHRIRSLFLNSWIKRRHLTLPPYGSDGLRRVETQGELLRKHVREGLSMAHDAIMRCLEQANAKSSDIRYLCCVSTTGFITPGFSALLIKKMNLSPDCARIDVVGMGCNAGLNGLSAVAAWSSTHPGQLALLVCVEVCSAAYVFDGSIRTAVVNSLFGDGAAALALIVDEKQDEAAFKPSLLRFSSCIIPDEIDAMRYEWDDAQGKFSFFLDAEVPYTVGAYAQVALQRLLKDEGLRPSSVNHWLVHSGGKKVIDSVRVNLGLTRHDMRHTIGVLQDHGNVSSGSFLFSYERLIDEGIIVQGDYGVMMTMGPGSTIEMALLHWN